MKDGKLEQWECIVAIEQELDAWVLARSDFIKDRDILLEFSCDDNCFDNFWQKDRPMGVYLLEIRPSSYQDSRSGEIDVVINVSRVTPLWTAVDKGDVKDDI